MANYTLQLSALYDKQVASSDAYKPVKSSCAGMETGPYSRNGVLQIGMEWLSRNAVQRYGVKPVLGVGDTVEVFEVPTYSRLTDVSVFHDCLLGDFRFNVEFADVMDNADGTRTVTPRAGLFTTNDVESAATVEHDVAAAAMGGVAGRNHFHLGDDVRNNHRAVVRIVITAAPPAPGAGDPPAANFFDYSGLDLFARFDRYASCVADAGLKGAFKKSAVTTVTI